MIINEGILLEKFEESEDKGYDYLIDNAETDKQAEDFLGLQELANSIIDAQSCNKYINRRNIVLEEIGVNISLLSEA